MSFEFDLSHEIFLDLVDFMRDVPQYQFYPTFSPSFNAADFLYLCATHNLGAKFVLDPVEGASLIFRWNCENFAINYYCCYHNQIMDILSKVKPFYPVDSVITFRTRGLHIVDVRPNEGRIGYKGRRMYRFSDYVSQLVSYFYMHPFVVYRHVDDRTFSVSKLSCAVTVYIDTTSTEAIVCIKAFGEPIRLVQEKDLIAILKANKWIQ